MNGNQIHGYVASMYGGVMETAITMSEALANALEYAWRSEVIETEMKESIEETEEEWKLNKLEEWLKEV